MGKNDCLRKIIKGLDYFVIGVVLLFFMLPNCHKDYDGHLFAIPNDRDNDYLTDRIEYYFGLDSTKSDTNGDEILDGVELAHYFSAKIKALPTTPQDSVPFVQYNLVIGWLDTCPVCGERINKGFAKITNPHLNLKVGIPTIGLHYLQYGSLHYEYKDGNIGDIDPIKLDSALLLIPLLQK